MSGSVTRVNQPLAAISVGNHSQDLVIWKSTIVTTLILVLLPLLLLLLRVVPAPATTTTSVKPRSRLQFTLQQSRRALGGAAEQFTVNMKEAKRLSTLKDCFSQGSLSHSCNTSTSSTNIGNGCFPPLVDVNRQLLNL